MPERTFPYLPLRWAVYNRCDLYAGLVESDLLSYAKTVDFAIYKHYVSEGRSTPADPFVSMMQALHDHSITQATRRVLADKRVAAIMGGHTMRRDSPGYRNVVCLARRLTRSGVLTCSGGATGVMEAAHLGAALAHSDDDAMNLAIAELGSVPEFPDVAKIVRPDGSVDDNLVSQTHKWLWPAFRISGCIVNPGESLAIPTWHYGFEPPTPFASHIAKYFQNSIREDGLLAVAKHGIVYTEGRAGTLQEIFQDAAQNHYRSFDWFSPMVFLGEAYWRQTYPVESVLKKLFREEDFQKYVLFTDEVDKAASFIEDFSPEIRVG